MGERWERANKPHYSLVQLIAACLFAGWYARLDGWWKVTVAMVVWLVWFIMKVWEAGDEES